MSITDELRKYAEENECKSYCKLLNDIADRIDSEHQRQLDVLYRDMSDAELVRLPKDADGVPIRVGDVMEWVRYEDDDPTIVRNVSAVGNGVFFAWIDELGRYSQYEAHAYRHHHALTVEDVLREFAEKVIDSQIPSVHPTYEEAITEYAAKLRLVDDRKEQ